MSQLGKNLVSTIKKEKAEFQKASFELAPSYANTIPRIIELVDLYWVDRFKGNAVDENGWKRAFFNVIKNPTLVTSKQIDRDTKDIRVIPAEGQSHYPAWIYSRDLKRWMKTTKLGLLLNELVLDLPKYGSIIVKKAAGNKIFNTHLDNVWWEATQRLLRKSRFVDSEMEMAEHELNEMEGIWDGLAGALAEVKKSATGRIKVYDRFGIHKGAGKNNYHIVTEGGVILHKAEYESVDEIWRKLDWDRIKGRGIGRGVVEDLMENQINRNRVEDFKNSALDWTSKLIFQTRDDTFARNLLTDVDNGEVLNIQDNLTQVNNSEKNLPAYRESNQEWDQNRKEKTFAFAENSGERPPSGTPLGTTKLTLGQSGSYFDQRGEEFSIWFSSIITDWVIPEFRKERRIEHKIMLGEFSEDELIRIKFLVENSRVTEKVFAFVKKNGRIPSAEERELMKSVVKEQLRKEKDMTIPARYYEQEVINATVDVIMSNERMDIAAEITTNQTALTLLAQNPALLDDPRVKKLFYRQLSLVGKNPLEISVEELPEVSEAVNVASKASGGSVPRPNPVPSSVREPVSA
jgi:hypothetical protein|tara:strand:- start:17271 stop:18995 length:1725 start_codon:yes stop_codon:yes gene_type:complete